MATILIICIILVYHCSAWTDPILVNKTYNSLVSKVMNVYTDPISKDTHILWLTNTNKITYSKIHDRNLVITKEFKLYSTGGSIAGADDGKHIYLAVSQNREDGFSSCQPKSSSLREVTGGCHDVYYLESEDNGNTWTNPTRIQRGNMNDVAYRGVPTILFIENTMRLFIFYPYNSLEGSKIGYVSKPKGSLVFSKEKFVCDSNYVNSGINAVYTVVEKPEKVTIILSWIQKSYNSKITGDLLSISSSNLGITWSGQKVIGSVNIETDMEYWSQSTMTALSKENVVFLAYSGIKGGELLQTNNNGEEWETVAQFNKGEQISVPFITICGDKKVFSISAGKNVFNFGYFDFAKSQYVERPSPFIKYNSSIISRLICYKNNNDYVLSSVATVMDKDCNYYVGISNEIIE